MIEIRRILCPIDFSEHSRRALDHAVAIARWYGATVTVLHVFVIMPVADSGPGVPLIPAALLTEEDRAALLEAMQQFTRTEIGGSVNVEYDVAEGSVPGSILDRAQSLPADLIVMGTHGRAGFDRLVLGSVTEKVLRKATAPVLTVPSAAPDAVPLPPPFQRILCGVDFSPPSMLALRYALSLAQEAGAALLAVNVLEPIPDLAEGYEAAHGLTEAHRTLEDSRRARLEQAIPPDARTGCSIETVLASGKPYREILRLAEERHIDLIVLGLHGHGALERLFFGSTTQHVVRAATCPVLTIRAQ